MTLTMTTRLPLQTLVTFVLAWDVAYNIASREQC